VEKLKLRKRPVGTTVFGTKTWSHFQLKVFALVLWHGSVVPGHSFIKLFFFVSVGKGKKLERFLPQKFV
jgi:hypothetical protein